MINFMGKGSNSSSSSNSGFCDDGQIDSNGNKLPFGHSSSSSPPSCSEHKGLLPLNYLQQQQRENQDDDVDLDHVVERDSVNVTCTGSSSRDVGVIVKREHMFGKVVTPSDVGKLNRLVIPKQHAERYFPLDSSTNEKGLLLNFEDRDGMPWRFRYSYWSSSQSYVITKGWSRFVRDKKLDAGDIVSFQKGVDELGKDRLFIDWRRRHQPHELPPPSLSTLSLPHHLFPNYNPFIIHPWNNSIYLQPPLPSPPPISYGHGGTGPYANYSSFINPSSSSVVYFRSAVKTSEEPAVATLGPQQAGIVQLQGRETRVEAMVFDSVTVSAHGKTAAKKLRLFGVNMECPMSESNEETRLPQFSSSNPTLQLRPCDGTLIQTVPSELPFNKDKSYMSLDLDVSASQFLQ